VSEVKQCYILFVATTNLWAYSNRKVVYQIINPSYSAILYVQRCVRYIQIRDYFTCQGLASKVFICHTLAVLLIFIG
jgi:hypothetical protein